MLLIRHCLWSVAYLTDAYKLGCFFIAVIFKTWLQTGAAQTESIAYETVDYEAVASKTVAYKTSAYKLLLFSISAIFNTWLQRGAARNHSVDSRPRHTRPGLLSMLHPSLFGMENSCCRLLWSVKRKKEKE